MNELINLFWSLVNALPQGSVSGGTVLALFFILFLIGIFSMAMKGRTGGY